MSSLEVKPAKSSEIYNSIIHKPKLVEETSDIRLMHGDITLATPLAMAISITAVFQYLSNFIRRLRARFNPVILPERESKRISDLLAQIGFVYKADRVVLGVFHSGKMTVDGFRYQKMRVSHAYVNPITTPLQELGLDVDLDVIESELKLLQNRNEATLYFSDVDTGCQKYMFRRGINVLYFTWIKEYDVVFGVIGMHYCSQEPVQLTPKESIAADLLISELTYIVKRYTQRYKR